VAVGQNPDFPSFGVEAEEQTARAIGVSLRVCKEGGHGRPYAGFTENGQMHYTMEGGGTSYVFGIPKTLAKRGSIPLVTPSKASA
jgi:hypothetical protein